MIERPPHPPVLVGRLKRMLACQECQSIGSHSAWCSQAKHGHGFTAGEIVDGQVVKREHQVESAPVPPSHKAEGHTFQYHGGEDHDRQGNNLWREGHSAAPAALQRDEQAKAPDRPPRNKMIERAPLKKDGEPEEEE